MDSTNLGDKLDESKKEVFSRLINGLDLNDEASSVLKNWKAEDESAGYPAERVLQDIQNSMATLYEQNDGRTPQDSIAEVKRVYETSMLSGSPLHCRAFKESLSILRVNHYAIDSVRDSPFVACAAKDLAEFGKKKLPLRKEDIARLQGLYQASLSLYPGRGYPYQPLDVEMEDIRLLVILPSKDVNSTIRCKMITRNKQFKEAYTALSYCWGKSNPDKPTKIELEGRPFEVTPNLHAALKRLRDSTCKTCIWVDALCINQTDIDERNSQVARMNAIYKDALFVTCFLGDAENDSDLIMNYLLGLHRAVDWEHRLSEPMKVQKKPSAAQMKATMYLVSREYWSRVWIMQEIVLARTAYVSCGNYMISWEVLTWFLLVVSDTIELQTGLEFHSEVRSLASQWTIPLANLWNRKINNLPLSPLLCLTMSRQRYATVSSDYIYGIMGFFQDLPFPVNYRNSAPSVYITLAVILLITSDNLDILTACKNFDPDFGFFSKQSPDMQASLRKVMDSKELSEKGARVALLSAAMGEFDEMQTNLDGNTLKLDNGLNPRVIMKAWEDVGLNCLPSWVPRWNQMIFNHQYIVLNTKRNARDQASANLQPRIKLLAEGTELQVAGLILDKVAYLSILKDEPKFQRVQTYDKAQGEQTVETWLSSLAPDWKLYEANFTKDSSSPYGNVESQKDAYVSNIFMGASFRSDRTEKLARENIASRTGWGSEKLASYSPEVIMDTIPKTQSAASFRFFITKEGYMGRGPFQMKSGDLVCIFYGGKVPFILRPVRSKYYLLGECYVQAMMSGEAIAKQNTGELQEQNFILI